MFRMKIVSRMMMAVIMTRNKNVSGKGKSKVWPLVSISPPLRGTATQLSVLCSTSKSGSRAKPGSIPPPTFTPILGEQGGQIGRVWHLGGLPFARCGRISDGVYSRKALHFSSRSLLQYRHPTTPTPFLAPFIVSKPPLSFSSSYCKSLGQSTLPRLIRNQETSLSIPRGLPFKSKNRLISN